MVTANMHKQILQILIVLEINNYKILSLSLWQSEG